MLGEGTEEDKTKFALAKLIKLARARSEPKGSISIVIPVFGSPRETLACISSVLLSPNKTEFRIVVVDDASPDELTRSCLDALAHARIINLVRHDVNRGFPAACNSGFIASGQDDVVILNSDVEVSGDWLDRMTHHMMSFDRIATLTPMTNDDSFTSYPIPFASTRLEAHSLELIDSVASRVCGSAPLIETPTGVGYCMYISREALSAVGGFDVLAFKQGYGEENDFCLRAADAGFKNFVVPNIFVKHVGGVSFGVSKSKRISRAMKTIEKMHPGYAQNVQSFLSRNPLGPTRQSIDVGMLNSLYPDGSEVVVTHSLGGGTERAIQEYARNKAAQGICPLVMRVDSSEDSGYKLVIRHAFDHLGENLGSYDLRTDLIQLGRILAQLGVRKASIQHLIDFNWFVPDLLVEFFQGEGIEYEVVLHDFWLICPRVTMTDSAGRYCGGVELSSCQTCLITLKSRNGDSPAVVPWHQRTERIFKAASHVYAPSIDTVARFNAVGRGKSVELRAHMAPASSLTSSAIRNQPQTKDRHRTVLVLGAISMEKGAQLLFDVAQEAQGGRVPLHFTVLGHTAVDGRLSKLENVSISGRYEENLLQALMQEVNPDLIWFPGMLPETYSFTLNAVIEAEIYPALAFDIGAVGHRITSEKLGWTVPLDHGLDTMQTLRDLNYFSSGTRVRAWLSSRSSILR